MVTFAHAKITVLSRIQIEIELAFFCIPSYVAVYGLIVFFIKNNR